MTVTRCHRHKLVSVEYRQVFRYAHMAGIQHANSIIADSITSASSPTRAIHEEQKDNDTLNAVDSEREPQIRPKRVGRTYGRPKPRLDEKDVADEDLVSRARILRTAPRDADDQVIPESDDTFIFPWKEKLRAIDEGLDDDPTTHQSEINPSRIAGDCDASNTRTELSGANETKYETPQCLLFLIPANY